MSVSVEGERKNEVHEFSYDGDDGDGVFLVVVDYHLHYHEHFVVRVISMMFYVVYDFYSLYRYCYWLMVC